MSLVAYGDSDDSDNSDSDDGSAQVEQKSMLSVVPPAAAGVAGDRLTGAEVPGTAKATPVSTVDDIEDDEPIASVPPTWQALKLPPPKHESQDGGLLFKTVSKPQQPRPKEIPLLATGSVLDENEDPLAKTPLLSGLPLPKATESSSSSFLDEDVVEVELQEKAAKLAASAAKPPTRQRTRQPVKITIPDLPEYDSDDEDEPRKKKTKASTGKCGLFSLLPAPKHASVKTTNRPLLPYTLSKKPVPNKPVPPKIAHAQTVAKPSKPVLQLPGRLNDDSDDEGDTVPSTSNFFSLGEHREKDSVAQSHQPNVTPTGSEVAKQEPSLRGPWQAPEAAASTLLGSTLTRTHNVQANDNTATCGPDPHSVFKASASAGSEKLPERDHISDAPLSFSRKSQEWGTGSSYAIPGTSVATSSVQSAADYAEPDTNSTYTYANYSEDNTVEGETPSGEVENFLQDDEFLKLAGKRQRGREAIDIIDVHADDQTSSVDLTKNLTEESSAFSHSRKRKDLPSSQQRRKHQITYLAYQAKERELELKNQWAENRMSRKQTQSKYGF